MSDVIGLDGKSFKPEEDEPIPVDALIEAVEGLLVKAKSGELRNLTYIGAYGGPDPRYINVCVEHTDYKPVSYKSLMEERL